MKWMSLSVLTVVGAALGLTPAERAEDWRATLDRYNVVWSSPSRTAAGAMPIGNGEVGLNVWVEEQGDLRFYMSRTDSWSECGRLLKLGALRVELTPNPFPDGGRFRQELRLRAGCLEIVAGENDQAVRLVVLVDAHHPVVHVVGTAAAPTTVKVSLENWRTECHILTGTGGDSELASSWTMHDAPALIEVVESADVVADEPGAVIWYHRNGQSAVPLTLKHQGLEGIAAAHDPLLHRTFGGRLSAAGFEKVDARTLATSAPVRRFEVRVAMHTAQTPTAEQWLDELRAADRAAPAATAAQSATAQWWDAFWSRSWIFVEGDRQPPLPANEHPLRIGADSNNANLYFGALARATIYDRPLSDEQVARLAAASPDSTPAIADGLIAHWHMGAIEGGVVTNRVSERLAARVIGDVAPVRLENVRAAQFAGGHLEVANDAALALSNGFTLEAWIRPDAERAGGRIFDKLTAGGTDGFLFDTHPGRGLRQIAGTATVHVPDCLKPDRWTHVATTYDPATGRQRLYLDGRPLHASAASADPAPPSRVTQAYILQRWIQACGGRGNYPIKFNGSIFTVEPRYGGGPDFNADWRRWGDCFWWQNTRLPYHPMLAAGDFDMLAPLFHLYETVAPLCAARAQAYHGVEGVYFPETMTIFGTYSNGDYGWDRAGHEAKEVLSPWWQYAWNQGPELVALMLDYWDYTRDERFLREEALPMAAAVLKYFDTRFARDSQGKLVISPAQAVETHWHNVVNDAPTVAGLHAILNHLRKLPETLTTAQDRQLWDRLYAALPDIPVREDDAVRMLAAAEKFDPSRQNVETPELYAVFPYRLFGVGKPRLGEAREAYRRRHDKMTGGWSQDGQFAALLGLTDEARQNVLAKVRNSHPNYRFPAMWGPNFDWVPDQDHGSNLLHTLQCMLLQNAGDELIVLPAWPKDWNVSFRLRGPDNTTVECVYRNGNVQRLEVTPKSSRHRVVAEPH